MYTLNNKVSKYKKQKLTELKEKIQNVTITFKYFNIPLFSNC